MTFDDEKYESLRKTLKRAPRLKAKSDFESRLFERIREAEKAPLQTEAFKHHPQVVKLAEPKRGLIDILAGLFKPAFAPALGLTALLIAAIVVYFGYFNKMNDSADQESFSYKTPEDLIIYVKSSGADSFSHNYPKEYSAITDGERLDDSRTYSPHTTTSDFYAPSPTLEQPLETISPIAPATERDAKLDRVTEEQRIEMQKGYDMKKGVDSKSEGKMEDGIMKKEGRNTPKKESKTEDKSNMKKNIYIDSDDESGDVNQQQVEPNISNEEKEDTGDKEKNRSRISRAIKDSSKTKSESEKNLNEPVQQK